MRMTTIRRPLTTLVVGAALLAAGCILSGQFIIVVPVSGDIVATHTNVGFAAIDLTDNGTWEEHSDDIQSIIDLKFECKIINNDATASASGEVWISPTSVGADPSAEDVRTHEGAFMFISGVEVEPSSERDITFAESATFITNLEDVLDIVEGGVFYVYGIAAEPTFNITITGVEGQAHGRIMVTFSAG